MKILIMKFRNIGDVLLTTPLIENLKIYYPNSSIHFALNDGTQSMIAQNPLVDKIHIYKRNLIKKAPFFKRLMFEFQFAMQIKKEKFDLIIQTTEGNRGLFIAKICKPKILVSYPGNISFLNKIITHKIAPQGYRHSVEANLDALRALGFKPQKKTVRIYFDDFAQKLKDLPDEFIHIHPMSRWLFKCIADEIMAEIIDFCELKLNKRVVLTCDKNSEEIQKTNHILSFCRSKPITFLGTLSLKEVAFLSKKAKLFVGVDTAIMHMAAALNTPCIAFFGPSSALKWGPWDNNLDYGYEFNKGIQTHGIHTVFQKDWQCINCDKAGCNDTLKSACLLEITDGDLQIIKNIISTKIGQK